MAGHDSTLMTESQLVGPTLYTTLNCFNGHSCCNKIKLRGLGLRLFALCFLKCVSVL